MTIIRSCMTPEAIEELINQRVAEALAAYEANRATELTVEREMETEMVEEMETEMEEAMGMEIPIRMTEDVRNAENKRRFDKNQKDNRVQQPLVKRQNVGGQSVARAYTASNNEKRGYAWPLPYCNKCKLHHEWPCTMKCGKYNKGHYRNECPRFKNQTRGIKAGNKTNKARGKAYVLGGGEVNPDSNIITGTFLLNNHYASMLFDSGADRSFVSYTFSALLDVIPYILYVSYVVELVDGRISETNIVLKGYTLGLLGHPYNIYLMLVELGSFNIIIGMDWLANHHAMIICDEKIMRIPYGDKVLIVQGDRSGKEKKSKLSIISCTMTQNYIKKGCLIFLAQVTKKETEDKSEEKRLKDVPIVRDFPEVFSEDLPGLPPTQQVEFQVDLVLGAAPVLLAITEPMTKLTQKSMKFDWGEKSEAAFQLLKQKLCSAPILALPEGSENFVVYCDASHKGLGTVLMQREKVIAYASR
ncbi:putative reverse transcriptase domain-containing protein [Tanacetum coccineum]